MKRTTIFMPEELERELYAYATRNPWHEANYP